MSAFNFEQFEEDFGAQRITPERAEEMAQSFRDAHEDELEKAASILERSGEQPDEKTRRRIERIEAKATEHLRAANDIDSVLARGQGRKSTEGAGSVSQGTASQDTAPSQVKKTGIAGAEAKWSRLFSAQSPDAFMAVNSNTRGRADEVGRYLSAALSGKVLDASYPQLRFENTATEGVGSEGGYLVPERLVGALWNDAITMSSFLSRARVYPMSGPVTHVTGPDWQDRTGGVVAGLLGVWLAEAEEGAEDKTLFRKIELHAHKVGIFSQISSELAEDAINVEAEISNAMRVSTGYTVDHVMLHGLGVNQPLGVLNSPALITVTAEGSQTADTLTARNISKMADRMDPASMKRAEWFASPTLLSELYRLQFQGRTDAGAAIADHSISATSLFQAHGNGTYSLMGRPLHFVEHMPTKGDAGDILFADWSRYAVGIRRAANIERSNAPGWMKDSIDYRITMRVAGAPEDSQAITPQAGDTFSPFVILGAR